MSRTVVMVAAEAREFAGLRRRVASQPLEIGVEFSRISQHHGTRLLMVANGPGDRLAAQAVRAAVEWSQPDAIVSTGVCGALDPALRVGQIVVADRVIDDKSSKPFQTEPLSKSPSYYKVGTVVTTDRVAVTAADKLSLRNRGAAAVEMEAAAVAAGASERMLPFFCVRAVSDTAEDDLVLNFNDYRDADGRFSRSRIAAAALMRPWSRVPALLRIDRNTRAAAAALGDFLADCRF